jgi:hypothetical protein
MTTMIDCPCGKYKIAADTRICPYCGELLTKFAATQALDGVDDEDTIPRWGTARLTGKMHFVIRVRHNEKVFEFDPNDMVQVVIGRKDPDTGEQPDVDLSDSNGNELGVSRRHAVIVRKDSNSLYIIDRGSPNGTYLNGQRLIANQPRILRDMDELRLGRLVMNVSYERR